MLAFIRNAVVLQILILAAVVSWVHGGTRPDLLIPTVPWLTLLVIEMALVFPQAKSTETLSEARLRVWRSLVRDPLLYVAILLTIYLSIPLFNAAGAPRFLNASGKWFIPFPPFRRLPFCVKADEQAVLLLWFVPSLFSALAARHALLKRGKRLLLEGLCWNGALLSAFGYWQLFTGAKSVYWGKQTFAYFFSTFGYPNFAGAFFTLLFLISLGLWFGHVSVGLIGPQAGNFARARDDRKFWTRHRMLFAMFFNLMGALGSLSRAAILLSVLLGVVYGIYMFIGSWQHAGTGKRTVLLTTVGLVVFIGVLSFTILAPASFKKEIVTITPESVLDRVSGAGYHPRVAWDIFRDYPLFGVGGWGYPHYQRIYMQAEDFKHFQTVGGVNVHNDFLQFLAELGGVGTGLVILTVFCLVIPAILEQIKLSKYLSQPHENESKVPHPKWLYKIPPEELGVWFGCTATVLHSLGDLPFRTSSIQIVWFCALACVSGFIPKDHHTSSLQ